MVIYPRKFNSRVMGEFNWHVVEYYAQVLNGHMQARRKRKHANAS